MKAFMVLASLVALAAAEPPVNYGAPSQNSGYGAPAQISSGYGAPDSGYGVSSYQPTVYRHVYVHSAPDEPVYAENKVIRVPGGGDKHVNIIFVKAPSSSSQQNTEVVLPEQPHQKTIVYVLVKKPESYSNVNVKGPQPTKPSKPEVFFIRYKGADSGYGVPQAPVYNAPVAAPVSAYGLPAAAPVSSYGPPAAVYAPVQQAYGAPAQQGY